MLCQPSSLHHKTEYLSNPTIATTHPSSHHPILIRIYKSYTCEHIRKQFCFHSIYDPSSNLHAKASSSPIILKFQRHILKTHFQTLHLLHSELPLMFFYIMWHICQHENLYTFMKENQDINFYQFYI